MIGTGDARVRNAVFSGGSIWFFFASRHQAAALDPTDGVTIWVYGAYPVSEKVWRTCVGALRA
jgi:hypothetical protein